ncbi:hypothetical protein JOQ06_003077 [Pogonophryne albipinna]|uniref:Uncharacterized protein n=1 Tax=Pogonophryne albipinna TaxID=1090488 RepID=A0AAD6FKN2_9TELE|nr:hypothetical protein JOQ06_003077 [Pogonophryne albipinna]
MVMCSGTSSLQEQVFLLGVTVVDHSCFWILILAEAVNSFKTAGFVAAPPHHLQASVRFQPGMTLRSPGYSSLCSPKCALRRGAVVLRHRNHGRLITPAESKQRGGLRVSSSSPVTGLSIGGQSDAHPDGEENASEEEARVCKSCSYR